MTEQNYSNNDEIDLSDLFSIIWAHKILIGIVTSLSIFFSGYYAVTAEKKYTARTVFQIEQEGSNGFSIPGEFGVLASFAGVGGVASSGSEVLLERMTGREFILQASQKLKFEDDPVFQTYVPNSKDPLWKAIIKKLIGWQKSIQEERLIIQDTIRKNYLEYVVASETAAGAIEISVTHESPDKAAQYANGLMEIVRLMIEEEENKSKDFRLSYLAETLADALQEMETAQNNLKNYALENSTAAQENFIVGSLELDSLRVELRETNGFINVLDKLSELVKQGNLNDGTYQTLRVNLPLVDDVNFRRILGMSETISAWSWPDLETINNVNDTLQDRILRLNVEIADIEENAKRLASSAEDLAELNRDMKIAEATFTVLTEQVKSQSLVAGFKPETFKVFSYASVPLAPSSPKRNLILVLGAVLGLFMGSAISLINGMRSGVFYNRASMLSQARAISALRFTSLRRIAQLPFSKLIIALEKRRPAVLIEAAITLSRKKIVYVVHSGGKTSASQTAQLLATQSFLSDRNILLFDPNVQSEDKLKESKLKDVAGLSIVTSEEGFDLVRSFDGFSFFTSKNFEEQLNAIVSLYDQIFISSNDQYAKAFLHAMKPFDPGLVVMTCLRKTKKNSIEKLQSIHPISILFHD